MSDNGATSVPPQTFVECGLCYGAVNISWFCKNCSFSLCDARATAHQTAKQYKSHAVVPRTYTVLRLFGPAKLAEQCHLHPEKEVSSYCNDCNVACCVTCMVKDHKRHDFSTIEDKYLDAEKSLNEYYRKLDTDVRPELDELAKQAKADVNDDEMNVEKVINDINNFRKDVVQNFNRACDDLIVQVQNSSSKRNEGLKEIENSIKNLESIKKEIEEKITKGNLNLIEYKPPKIEALVPRLKAQTKIVPIFEPQKNVFDIMKQPVGNIRFKAIKENEIESKRSIRSVQVRKIETFESKIAARSLTRAGNNRVWAMNYENETMYLYNDIGEEIRTVTFDGSKGINDMAITKTAEMIVTCQDKKVRCVSVDGKVSILIHVTTDPFTCKGVCLTDNGEIVVCMNDQDDKNHVAVYSTDGGSKLRKIRGRRGQGKHLITKPYRVVQNDEDLCVVNISENVVCVDERDNVRWVYDGKQTKLERPFLPRCICRDQYNNLLVADFINNCVHYISREGELIQVILIKGHTSLTNHYGICVDDVNEHVWVGSYGAKTVIVAKIEYKK